MVNGITTQERIELFIDERLVYQEGSLILFDDLQQEISNDFGAGAPEMVYPLLSELCFRHHRKINHKVTKVWAMQPLNGIDTPDRPVWPENEEKRMNWWIENRVPEDQYLHTVTNLRWRKPHDD